MKKFKHAILTESIVDCLMTGVPSHSNCPFPTFLFGANSHFLKKYLGSDAYDIFIGSTPTDQNKMIKWYETHGFEATKLYGGELYEDWDQKSVAKRNLRLLFDSDKDLYMDVMTRILTEAFPTESSESMELYLRVCKDPAMLEFILLENVKL